MKKYLYLIKNAKIPTYLKYWLMYSSKKISLLIQSLPITLEDTIKNLKIVISKIYGNTEQATRSGKNLFNINGDVNTRYDGTTNTNNTVSGNDLTTTTNAGSTNPYGQKIYVGTGNTVTFSAKLKSVTYDNTPTPTSTVAYITLYNENTSENRQSQSFAFNNVGTVKSVSFTALTDYIYATFGRASNDTSATFTDIQVEIGSTATPYELYGASPSPDYPSPVNNVTGDVEITITNEDNTQEQNYPISLGSLELCKIGMAQDYIYKENGNWYKYGAIGKVVLDGSEDESYSGNSNLDTTDYKCYYISNSGCIMATNTTNVFVYCDKLLGTGSVDRTKNQLNCWINHFVANNLMFHVPNTVTNLEGLRTWLTTNNLMFYYVLATPVTTQITDTTLINQLNALEEAKSYEDVTNISSNQNIYLDIDYIKRG